MERSPPITELLDDGGHRARYHSHINSWLG
jgi:hypothetical protein